MQEGLVRARYADQRTAQRSPESNHPGDNLQDLTASGRTWTTVECRQWAGGGGVRAVVHTQTSLGFRFVETAWFGRGAALKPPNLKPHERGDSAFAMRPRNATAQRSKLCEYSCVFIWVEGRSFGVLSLRNQATSWPGYPCSSTFVLPLMVYPVSGKSYSVLHGSGDFWRPWYGTGDSLRERSWPHFPHAHTQPSSSTLTARASGGYD